MLDDLRAQVARLPEAQGALPGLREGLVPLGPGGLSLFRAARPVPIECQVYGPTVCLVLQGAKALRWDNRARLLGEGEMLLVGADLAVDVAVARAPYLAVALPLDASLLRELAAEDPRPASDAPGPPAPPVELPLVVDPSAGVAGAMARLLALRGSPRAERALAPLMLRELHWWLLESPQGPSLRDLVRADGRAARIARAVALIRAGLDRPIRVPDLAREAGMSASSFHEHFRAVTATTPLQLQKRLRLIEARRLLRAEGSGVGAAAFAVGYESSTQFSRDYARAFGHPPRQDRGAGWPVAAE